LSRADAIAFVAIKNMASKQGSTCADKWSASSQASRQPFQYGIVNIGH
jgi:hypothetical protein